MRWRGAPGRRGGQPYKGTRRVSTITGYNIYKIYLQVGIKETKSEKRRVPGRRRKREYEMVDDMSKGSKITADTDGSVLRGHTDDGTLERGISEG